MFLAGRNRMESVFCGISLAGILLGLLGCVLGYLNPYYLLFANRWDIGMDFFNPVFSVYAHTATLYPPLPMLGYALLGFGWAAPLAEYGAAALRSSWAGTLVYAGYFALGTGVFSWLVLQLKKGTLGRRGLFLTVTVFSAPFLFQFERGNLIFPVLVLILFFMYGKDSSRGWVRQLAILSLAAAGACKFYPLVLGIILVREKRWKDILFLCLYTVLLFCLPAFLYGGPEIVYQRLWRNMQLHLNYVRRFSGVGYAVSAYNTGLLAAYWTDIKVSAAAGWISYGVLTVGALAAWWVRENWRAWALAGCLMVLVPEMSGFYSLILLFPAVLMLLDGDAQKGVLDWVCLSLLIVIWIPVWLFPVPETWYRGQLPLYGETLVCRFAVLVLFGVLCAAGVKDGILRLFGWWRRR